MTVLVSDTSVLIYLERGSFLETSFHLPDLLKLGLRVAELDGDGMTRTLGYRRHQLSLPDCCVLALAKGNAWILLTGDSDLRKLADNERVDYHGVLWVLDQMHDATIATCMLVSKRSAFTHGAGLPKAEIDKRFTRYKAELVLD